jgi:Amt family ammonium transporter
MVAITPAAGFVRPVPAILLGALAAMASFTAVRLRPKLGLDDSLDVFAVHGVAATLGAILTGAFATTAVNPAGADASALLVAKQALGVAVTMAFSGGLSFALLKLVALVTPLRAEEQDEWNGMDASDAGERGYIMADESAFGPTPSPSPAPPLAHAQPGTTPA